jgi:two-component system, chemotaxis family, chemotaxis protein CheY
MVTMARVRCATRKKGFEAGANLYIVKPCSPEVMTGDAQDGDECAVVNLEHIKSDQGASEMPASQTVLTPKTIMTIDDSPSIRLLVAFTLHEAGFAVVEAAGGQEALDMAAKTPVNLFITDLNMPNMDGIELIRQLRALAQFKFVPILLLTTESQPEKSWKGKRPALPDGLSNRLIPRSYCRSSTRSCAEAEVQR